MNAVEDLKARGLVDQSSAPIETILAKPRTVYLGIDPTADSMHVGHLVPILLMRRLGEAGHKLILLVGGGTGMVGDPKERGERVLLDMKTIDRNKKTLAAQMKHVVGRNVRMVDNAEWLGKLKLVDFLRDTGKHFTVNDLVKRELIKKRLETPDESISYTEFTYSLLQAYDYSMLHAQHSCDLQIGGSDQWTNILSGVELIRKTKGHEVYALTFPLISDGSGRKFGKSEGNAVWLDAKKTSPFQFYQFWLATDDRSVANYLKVFTFLSLSEINTLAELHSRNPERRVGQKKLAAEVTKLVHGPDEAERAERYTEVLFGNAPFASLSKADQDALFKAVPAVSVNPGTTIVDALTTTDFTPSKSEARRLIDSKGIKLNGETLEIDRVLQASDFNDGLAILQKGKSDKLLVRFK